MLPHLHKALQHHGSHVHAYIKKHAAAPCSTPIYPCGHNQGRGTAMDTSELTRDGCFTASITNRLCKVLAAVSGAFNAGSGYQAAAP